MASFNIDSLAQDIRIALDQNMESDQLSGITDIDTLSLNDIIKSKIVDAVRLVEMSAPLILLDGGTAFPSASQVITWESQAGYGPGSVPLPANFMRLVCFKMSDWDHPVFIPISETDPLYAVQRSRFGGVRGNPQKPVCAIVNSTTGLRLEFYSCAADSDASVAMASYIPIPTISGTGSSAAIDIPTKVKSAVVYKAAAMTAESIQRADLAAALNAMSDNMLQ